MNSQDTGRQLG